MQDKKHRAGGNNLVVPIDGHFKLIVDASLWRTQRERMDRLRTNATDMDRIVDTS